MKVKTDVKAGVTLLSLTIGGGTLLPNLPGLINLVVTATGLPSLGL